MNKKLLTLVVLSALGTCGGANALEINTADTDVNFNGIISQENATLDNPTESVKITQTSNDYRTVAIGHTAVNFNVKDIEIKSENIGIRAERDAHILKASNKLTISSSDDAVYAVYTDGRVTLQGDQVEINSSGAGNALKTRDDGSIDITGKTVTLSSAERGAVAAVGGSISVTADELTISSVIRNTKDSALRYRNAISVGGPVGDGETDESASLTIDAKKLVINISDESGLDDEDKQVNAIASDTNGTLNLTSDDATVNGNINTNGKFNLNGTLNFNGEQANIANLVGNSTINLFNENQELTVNNKGTLTVAGSGDLNDSYAGDLNSFFEQVSVSNGETGETTILLKEGLYNGETSAEIKDGELTNIKSSGASSVMRDTLDIAAGSTVMLNRILMNDVHKRMGDLRNNAGMNGAWVRYDGGRLSGGHVANKFNTIQLGADMPFADNFHAGVSASYTRGDVDFTRGGAGMDAYSLAAYGTWFAPNGMYADVVARYGHVKNELTVDHNLKGDLDNNAVALSGEFGWKFDVADNFFVTPQVEATYMHIDSDTVKLGNKASYKFDSVDSFIGRAGLAAGYTFPNQKGNVFVKASAVHEFAGDSKVTSANGTNLKKDGKDTWAEFGVGTQYNFNKNVQAWANLERTAGADIEEDYRATVGARINF